MATREQQQAGLARRQARYQARIEFFTERVLQNARLTAAQRVRIATQLLRDRVVINLSTPVTKTRLQAGRNSRGRLTTGRTVVTDRSQAGEFPRADTTRLLKDIFGTVTGTGDSTVGRVGTTLDYGLILETQMDRSFLVRTFDEMRGTIRQILTRGNVGGLGLGGGFQAMPNMGNAGGGQQGLGGL